MHAHVKYLRIILVAFLDIFGGQGFFFEEIEKKVGNHVWMGQNPSFSRIFRGGGGQVFFNYFWGFLTFMTLFRWLHILCPTFKGIRPLQPSVFFTPYLKAVLVPGALLCISRMHDRGVRENLNFKQTKEFQQNTQKHFRKETAQITE